MSFSRVWLFLIAAPACCQLVPATSPIPNGPNPPVVFLNGYQEDCTGSNFAGTFGNFDQILQANGRVSIFFDNCNYPNKPSLESLGNSFGTFLSGLKYQDGSPVTQVDVVAHSMGGLIVRSYLAGFQPSGTFTPPVAVPIRKYLSIAVPNFGTASLAVEIVVDTQTQELAAGSQFVFNLGTWNQGTDDLRGVDALAIIGNGGTGLDTMSGFDDGVVALTSGSIGFARPNRTRIVNACHTSSGIITLFGFCPPSAPPIAAPTAATDPTAAIAVSFLAGNTAWQSTGQAAEQNQFLSVGAGLEVRLKSAADAYLAIDNASLSKPLNIQNNAVAYTEYVTPLTQPLSVTSGSTTVKSMLNLQPGFVNPVIAKNGPQILRVLPSAAAVFPLAIAPVSYISVYGSGFTPDTVVTAAGQTLQLVGVVAATQVNAILPASVSGFIPVTAMNSAGQSSVNVLIAPVVPTLFTQDSSGSGPASALNAVTNALITQANPLHAGDYVSLYLTGLGASASTVPVSVTVAGQACPLQYSGIAPSYTALDQINCQIPPGIASTAAAPVTVTAGGVLSNTVTVAIQ